MIPVTAGIALDERELREEFIRASGPGGQNVNKVATAVQLRFDALRSPSLPEEVRARLLRIAAGRVTAAGEIVILARRRRTQEGNRRDARERLLALLREAAVPPRPRRPTAPTPASRRRRLEAKRRAAAVKRLRRRTADEAE